MMKRKETERKEGEKEKKKGKGKGKKKGRGKKRGKERKTATFLADCIDITSSHCIQKFKGIFKNL